MVIKAMILTAQQRLLLIKSVQRGSKTVSEVCRETGISRKTYYKWLKRYPNLEDKAWKILTHPKKYSKDLESRILTLVEKSPQLSSHKLAVQLELGNHGVQNFLDRKGLNLYDKRLAYAQSKAQVPVSLPKPVFAWLFDRVRSVWQEFVPNVAPAPPPGLLRSIKLLVTSSIISFTASYSLISWFSLIGRSGVSPIGIIFASLALLMGSLFFIYSIKYYLTLAVVLSFNQSETVKEQESKSKAMGLKPNLDNIVLTKYQGWEGNQSRR